MNWDWDEELYDSVSSSQLVQLGFLLRGHPACLCCAVGRDVGEPGVYQLGGGMRCKLEAGSTMIVQVLTHLPRFHSGLIWSNQVGQTGVVLHRYFRHYELDSLGSEMC